MPGQAPMFANERDGLLAFLRQQRDVIRIAAYGLTDEQARTTPSASTLSVGGLIKHVATVERGWIDLVLQASPSQSEEAYDENFRLGDNESLADVFALYDDVAARTESVINGIDDLDRAVPVPKGVPWYPQDLDAWSVRWVLLHVIQETARHAGHADIVRESIDGATAFELMAAEEGWPETPWIKPWKPSSG
jgi:uncharacterized damage-inducible protein DinB